MLNGDQFVTGACRYLYQSAMPELDKNPRIIIPILIGGLLTSAVLDTAAPFTICPPDLAERIGLLPEYGIDEIKLAVHHTKVTGHLHRTSVTFVAETGDSLELETVVYVSQEWGTKPAYIGLRSCLDSLRFAVDPHPENELFFFGQLPFDDYS